MGIGERSPVRDFEMNVLLCRSNLPAQFSA